VRHRPSEPNRSRKAPAAALCLLLAGCAGQGASTSFIERFFELFPSQELVGDAPRGRLVAEKKCIKCHAVQNGVPSRAASFPEMSTHAKLTNDALHKLLSRLPHPMPPIKLSRQEREDLIAYLHRSAIMER